MRSLPNKTGFTLIEVVIALGLMGLALIVLIELFSGALRLGKTAHEYSQAASWARLKFEEIIGRSHFQEGREEGELAGSYRWQSEIKKTAIWQERFGEALGPGELYQIKVRVHWPSGLKEKKLELETYKFAKEVPGDEKN